MTWAWCRTKRQHGFSPVEVLLAATIFAILATALVGAVVYARNSSAAAGTRARAVYLAQEGLEAARNIRDSGYANLPDGTHGLARSGGVWILSGSSDVSDIYTRAITVTTAAPHRKTVTAHITWPQTFGTASTDLVTELTNWTSTGLSWANAILAGSYDAADTADAVKVATVGDYAYVVRSGGTPNFLIVNISNPAAPALTGSLAVAGTPTNIAISGNYAYIVGAAAASELQIVDITNPASPTLTSTLNMGGSGGGLAVAVSGSYAYIGQASNHSSDEFTVVNVSNPAAPTKVGSYNNNIDMNSIVVSGNYAFVSTSSGSQEILSLSVSNPAAPTLASSLNLAGGGGAAALALNGATLFAAHGTDVMAIDVTAPTAPTVLGSVASSGTATVNDITLDGSGTYAFIGTSNATGEFQVVNISNPTTMSVVRTVDTTGEIKGVAWNAYTDIVVGATTADTQEVITLTKSE